MSRHRKVTSATILGLGYLIAGFLMRVGGIVAEDPAVRARLEAALKCIAAFQSTTELRVCLFGANNGDRPSVGPPGADAVCVAV